MFLSQRSCRDSSQRSFDHESGALPLSYPRSLATTWNAMGIISPRLSTFDMFIWRLPWIYCPGHSSGVQGTDRADRQRAGKSIYHKWLVARKSWSVEELEILVRTQSQGYLTINRLVETGVDRFPVCVFPGRTRNSHRRQSDEHWTSIRTVSKAACNIGNTYWDRDRVERIWAFPSTELFWTEPNSF